MDPSVLAKNPELLEFLNQEKERAMVNEMVAKMTSVCWDKCITSTPGSKFSSSEASCLTHCAQRYMDMSMIIMKRFQSMQNYHSIMRHKVTEHKVRDQSPYDRDREKREKALKAWIRAVCSRKIFISY